PPMLAPSGASPKTRIGARTKIEMAIYHATVKSFSRGKGHSSTAAAAYRAGIVINDELTGIKHDYTRRSGVSSVDMLAPQNAPEWARDPVACFNRSEMAETRLNARTARELEVALPAELNEAQRRALACDLGQMLVDRYQVAVLVAVHEPDKNGDERNHHVHLLMTPRQIGPDGLGPRACAEFDARGGAGPEAIRILREAVADRINSHLERAQVAERVDHRSLAKQAHAAEADGHIGFAAVLAREATQHEGKAATAMRRRGEDSERGTINNQIKNANRIELHDYLERLEQEGRVMATPRSHTQEAAQRERPAAVGKEERPHLGQVAVAHPRARTRPVSVAQRTGRVGSGAQRFPPSLKPALMKAASRLRSTIANKQADEAMARYDAEIEQLEMEARRLWLEGIDATVRQSLSTVAKLFDMSSRAGAYPQRASYRNDMRELHSSLKQVARDTTRWERRLQAEVKADISLTEAKMKLETWERKNPKPSFWSGSRRDWAQRRRSGEERIERRRTRRDAARLATGPEAQVKYAAQAAASVEALDKLAASMLKRYPITADTAQPHKSQRPGPTSTRTITEQLNDSQLQQRGQRRSRGPHV
ncbi:MobA/MobL family protein, partial [Stenotrophomonas maltophilia]|uniref:MobA/MobL family protein n=5 Tax=Bacteria TaxID=2 RepID=UPI001F537DEF